MSTVVPFGVRTSETEHAFWVRLRLILLLTTLAATFHTDGAGV